MRYLFLSHLGIGDHIIMNGLVHTVLKDTCDLDELCIIAVDDYRKHTLLHLYEDYPIVTFHWLKSNNGHIDVTDPVFLQINATDPGIQLQIEGKQYTGIPFGLHSLRKAFWIDSGTTWIDCLYKYPFKIPSLNRFTEFQCPKDLSRAEIKYQKLLDILGSNKYVVVHDDPSRNRHLDKKTLTFLLEKDTMKELPVIYLGYNRYSHPLVEGLVNKDCGDLLNCVSLFDLLLILQNASACHLMDSCIACLTDVSGINGKLYMHNYINEASGGAFTREPWVQIDLHR